MEITENKAGATLVLGLSGRLDATTSGQLEKLLNQKLQEGEHHLLFDFTNLQYISSAGLRVLAATLRQVTPAGGQMALCGMQEPVKMVFDISGFSSYFKISASRDDALASLP